MRQRILSSIYTELSKLNSKKNHLSLIRKWANNMKTHFTKKDIEMTNESKHLWKLIICSVSCTSEHVSQRNEIHTKTWARMVVAVLFVKTESYSQPNIR